MSLGRDRGAQWAKQAEPPLLSGKLSGSSVHMESQEHNRGPSQERPWLGVTQTFHVRSYLKLIMTVS